MIALDGSDVRLFDQVQVAQGHLIIPIATEDGFECEVLAPEGFLAAFDRETYPTVEEAIAAQRAALAQCLEEREACFLAEKSLSQ